MEKPFKFIFFVTLLLAGLLQIISVCSSSVNKISTINKRPEEVKIANHPPLQVSFIDLRPSKNNFNSSTKNGFNIKLKITDLDSKTIGENYSFIAPVLAVDNLGNKYYSGSGVITDKDTNDRPFPPGVLVVDEFFSPSLSPKATYIATIDIQMQALPKKIEDTVLKNLKPGQRPETCLHKLSIASIKEDKINKLLEINLKQNKDIKEQVSNLSYINSSGRRFNAATWEILTSDKFRNDKVTYKNIPLYNKPFDFIVKWYQPPEPPISFVLKNISIE